MGGLLVSLSSTVVSPDGRQGFDWVEHSFLFWAQFKDLSPNIGLYWYFFAQIFDRFRTYFIATFNGTPFLLVAPICIRLQR